MTVRQITFETILKQLKEILVDVAEFTGSRLDDYITFERLVTEYDPNGKKDDTQSIDLHLLSFNKMQVTVKNKMANEYRSLVDKYKGWMDDVLYLFGDVTKIKAPITDDQEKQLKGAISDISDAMNGSLDKITNTLSDIDMLLDKKAPSSVM